MFTFFAKCHEGYSGGVVSEQDIDKISKTYIPLIMNICTLMQFIGSSIKDFMACYRKEFPSATVLPKMHILEDHLVPWLRRWHIGCGHMGEQGAESLHAHLKRLETQHCGIVNPLERLQCVVNQHNLQSSPQLRSLQPPPKRQKMDK